MSEQALPKKRIKIIKLPFLSITLLHGSLEEKNTKIFLESGSPQSQVCGFEMVFCHKATDRKIRRVFFNGFEQLKAVLFLYFSHQSAMALLILVAEEAMRILEPEEFFGNTADSFVGFKINGEQKARRIEQFWIESRIREAYALANPN